FHSRRRAPLLPPRIWRDEQRVGVAILGAAHVLPPAPNRSHREDLLCPVANMTEMHEVPAWRRLALTNPLFRLGVRSRISFESRSGSFPNSLQTGSFWHFSRRSSVVSTCTYKTCAPDRSAV